jgi:WD40 repeat protein
MKRWLVLLLLPTMAVGLSAADGPRQSEEKELRRRLEERIEQMQAIRAVGEAEVANSPPLPARVILCLRTGRKSDGTWEEFERQCTFSPDGSLFAAVAEDRAIFIWRSTDWKRIREIPTGKEPHHGLLQFLPDGTLVGVDGDGDTVSFWDPYTGDRRRQFKTDREFILGLQVDSEFLLVHGAGKKETINTRWEALRPSLYRWTLSTGERTRVEGLPATRFETTSQFSPNGRFIRVLAVHVNPTTLRDNAFQIRKAGDGNTLIHQEESYRYLGPFSSDSQIVACGNYGSYGTGIGIRGSTLGCRFSRSGRWLWQVPTDDMMRVISSQFSHDDRLLAAASKDGSISLWEVASGRCVLDVRPDLRENPQWPLHAERLALSPDGKLLASRLRDGTFFIWDFSPENWKTPTELSAVDLREAWESLASIDARDAYRTVWDLSACPNQAVPMLAERLKPVPVKENMPVAKPEQLRKLIGQLDDESFDVREAASAQLSHFGRQALEVLREALTESPSAEVNDRVRALLDPLEPVLVNDYEAQRLVRAVWVLERIGNPQAKELLTKLSEGSEESLLTREAKASLQRLLK